jgi:spindle assembly abnormal protein 6
MVCTEQDFHILKHDQQLLVDFQAFPQSFTELVQYCQLENGYTAVFNTHECTLNIVESNQFRALTHLSLLFKRANDETLKKHLSERL